MYNTLIRECWIHTKFLHILRFRHFPPRLQVGNSSHFLRWVVFPPPVNVENAKISLHSYVETIFLRMHPNPLCSLQCCASSGIKRLRIHDPFSQKTTWTVTFMPFLWCHFISKQDRPNKVYFIGSILSRYQITAPNVRKCLVSYSFHGEGVMYP